MTGVKVVLESFVNLPKDLMNIESNVYGKHCTMSFTTDIDKVLGVNESVKKLLGKETPK